MENKIIVFATTAKTRKRLIEYFGAKVDFLDWEYQSEKCEDLPDFPLGMFGFIAGFGDMDMFDDDTTIYERAYRPFINALRAVSAFGQYETISADFHIEYKSDWLTFCIFTADYTVLY